MAVSDRLLDGLNGPQADAVSSLSGPLLVVAGPGSGKTRVLVHRVAALVESGIPAARILAVTFTNKAAAEMRSRLEQLVGDTDALWALTFHAACARMLRFWGPLAGFDPRFSIIDADDARRQLRRALQSGGQEASPRELDETLQLISRCKANMRTPDDLAASEDPWARARAAAYAAYQATLSAQHLLDFDDLLLTTRNLLATSPEFADRVSSKFSHVLIDEFQDTNTCQYDIAKRILGTGRNLCVVGDLDQSIYAFRSATPELMSNFTADWPDAKVVVLGENYRSTPSILAVAQSIIDPVPVEHRARLWTRNPAGAQVCVRVYRDSGEEAAAVAAEIAAEITSGRARADQCAVLYRTGAQSRQFEAALRDRAISYQLVGGTRFFDRAEVKDALAYLRAAANPFDLVSLARAAGVPKRKIGPKTFDAMVARAADAGVAVLEFVRGCRDAPAGWVSLARDVDTVLAAPTLSAAVAAVLAIPGFVATACARDGVEGREENLDELLAAAHTFERNPPPLSQPNLDDFLAFAALMSSTDAESDDGVRLSTAHAAKGKEFDAVWVVGCEDGFFPHANCTGDAEMDEERRLLFVAVSRARHRLTLTSAQRRMVFRDWADRDQSPFLADLPSDVRRVSPPGFPQRSSFQPRTTISRWPPAARPRPAAERSVGALAASDVPAGTNVAHPSFGAGTVISVSGETVTVRFGSATKVLMLRLAPLTLA